ncbi:hypothetical protein BDW22DRAFT_1430933 [Trametopsis cervina]|nr:hypothetical protein BDW22DRAFT_1430933 [Trametopsis cervina]
MGSLLSEPDTLFVVLMPLLAVVVSGGHHDMSHDNSNDKDAGVLVLQQREVLVEIAALISRLDDR